MADTRAKLQAKRLAYLRTFCGEGDNPHVNALAVLEDLKKYCGVTKPGIVVSPKAGVVDPYASIYRAGMRDVFQRIAGFLGIDERQLFQETQHEPESKIADA